MDTDWRLSLPNGLSHAVEHAQNVASDYQTGSPAVTKDGGRRVAPKGSGGAVHCIVCTSRMTSDMGKPRVMDGTAISDLTNKGNCLDVEQ